MNYNTSPQVTPIEDGGEVEEAGEEDRPDGVTSKTDKKEPKLNNQFSFCERASQTFNNPLRVGREITSLLPEEHLMSYLLPFKKFCGVVFLCRKEAARRSLLHAVSSLPLLIRCWITVLFKGDV